MKTTVFTIFIAFTLVSSSYEKLDEGLKTKLSLGVNGGANCAACTAIVGLIEEVAIVYNETVDETLERLCNYLPDGLFRLTCKEAVQEFGPIIISGFIF